MLAKAQHLPYPPYHPRAPNPIEVINWSPEADPAYVEEGSPLEVWCEVDNWWSACQITHVPSGKFCGFKVSCKPNFIIM